MQTKAFRWELVSSTTTKKLLATNQATPEIFIQIGLTIQIGYSTFSAGWSL